MGVLLLPYDEKALVLCSPDPCSHAFPSELYGTVNGEFQPCRSPILSRDGDDSAWSNADSSAWPLGSINGSDGSELGASSDDAGNDDAGIDGDGE
jgi:hypothetical protein